MFVEKCQGIQKISLVFQWTNSPSLWTLQYRATTEQYCSVHQPRELKNQFNVWNRLTFVNKHFIFSRSLKEPSSGNCVKTFDCRVFGQFETLPSCWAFRHCVKANLYILLWYLNSVITKIAKYIVLRMMESLHSYSLCSLEISLQAQALSGT